MQSKGRGRCGLKKEGVATKGLWPVQGPKGQREGESLGGLHLAPEPEVTHLCIGDYKATEISDG